MAQKKVRIRKEKLEIQQPTVREVDPPSREGYGATSATRVKIGPIEAFDGTPVIDIKSASTRAEDESMVMLGETAMGE
jgi:hypothetical protein